MHHFLHRAQSSCLLRRHRVLHRHGHIRTLYEAVSSIQFPRDRGLDHAVEREMHLKSLVNLKNLIISEPSKSVPLSLINDSRRNLQIPFRPIDFIRKYASAFQEFQPSSLDVQPHIKLTPEIISLDTEENLLYQSVNYKEEIAVRLLKLLMVNKIYKIPIFVLERLKWELGLPRDYEKAIIPEFPDYFRVIDGKDLRDNGKVLELVFWNDKLAISEMEKGFNDGDIQFPVQYPKGSEMDKKYVKWVDEWQKLPYVSPYENAMHLAATSDESDKWAVAVLHEVLNLFVGKKAERDSLLFLGECLGLRSRFKRAVLQHPGIFYVSSKIRTHTVVLKEAYKRGMLIERHPLMDLRFKYVQLMNVVKDVEEVQDTQEKSGNDVNKGGELLEDVENGGEVEAEMYNSESDESDESDDYEGNFDDRSEYRRGRFKRNDAFRGTTSRSVTRRTNDRSAEENDDRSENKRGRFKRNDAFRGTSSRSVTRRTNDRSAEENESKSSTRFSRRMNTRDNNRNGFSRRTNTQDGDDNRFPRRTNTQDGDDNRFPRRINSRDGNQNRFSRIMNTRHGDQNIFPRRMNTRHGDQNMFPRRINTRDGDQNSSRTRPQKLNF